jgi:uncharacterized protein (UPF0548 family)
MDDFTMSSRLTGKARHRGGAARFDKIVSGADVPSGLAETFKRFISPVRAASALPCFSMLFLQRPTEKQIHALLIERESMPFSYSETGATRSTPPRGYRVNHMRALLGKGKEVHARAVNALLSWRLLTVAGLELFPRQPAMRTETGVALLSRHFGLWSLDFCRVIYVLQAEPENGGAIERTGFAYGTLPGHAVRGEEIFSIEWHPATNEVWYDIFSFSAPANLLIRLGGPLARSVQKHFASASVKEAFEESGVNPHANTQSHS